MKLVYYEFAKTVETDKDAINTIIIENQPLFQRFISRLLGTDEDKSVSIISDGKELALEKTCEVITSFIPFEINKKPLINKLLSSLEKEIATGEFYERASRITREIELLLYEASINVEGNIDISDISTQSIIKNASPKFSNDFETLSEKVLEYFKLIYEYEGEKLFILVNYRCYVSDAEYDLFIKEVLKRHIHLICIENKEYNRSELEKRYIIDKDLCEI